MTRFKFLLNIGIVLALLVVLLLFARTFGIERNSMTPIEKGFKTVTAPFQNGASYAIQKIQDFFGMFSEISELRQENLLLKKRISELNNKINILDDFRQENERLHDLLNYKEEVGQSYKLLTARVIARNPSNWYSTIVLNKGSLDGIKKDMAVVTHEGLVGRIINVTKEACEVLLILDQEGAAGARVWETRETPGVIEGRGDGSLTMIHLPHDAEIKQNNTVVTSGLGGIFPPGIRIGTVEKIIDEESGLMKRAIVKPFVNFNKLEEVLVILQVFDINILLDELNEKREGAFE